MIPLIQKSLFFSRLFFNRGKVTKEFQVESYRLYKAHFIVKLEGIASIDQAQNFIGLEVLIPEADLHTLEEGSYYFHQISGFLVETKEGKRVGVVKDMLSHKNNDLLVVDRDKKEIFIPFTHAICVEINQKSRKVIIDPPEGLLELNEI